MYQCNSCETCKFFFEDKRYGQTECNNKFLSENELQTFFTEQKDGCRGYLEKKYDD